MEYGEIDDRIRELNEEIERLHSLAVCAHAEYQYLEKRMALLLVLILAGIGGIANSAYQMLSPLVRGDEIVVAAVAIGGAFLFWLGFACLSPLTRLQNEAASARTTWQNALAEAQRDLHALCPKPAAPEPQQQPASWFSATNHPTPLLERLRRRMNQRENEPQPKR